MKLNLLVGSVILKGPEDSVEQAEVVAGVSMSSILLDLLDRVPEGVRGVNDGDTDVEQGGLLHIGLDNKDSDEVEADGSVVNVENPPIAVMFGKRGRALSWTGCFSLLSFVSLKQYI